MPDPASGAYGAAIVELAVWILEFSRAAGPFYSSPATVHCARLHTPLESRLPYPLLVQGSAPQAELLKRFRRLGNAVLLGTASF